jgi:hypothetical protein
LSSLAHEDSSHLLEASPRGGGADAYGHARGVDGFVHEFKHAGPGLSRFFNDCLVYFRFVVLISWIGRVKTFAACKYCGTALEGTFGKTCVSQRVLG